VAVVKNTETTMQFVVAYSFFFASYVRFKLMLVHPFTDSIFVTVIC
jgi:hypothetical protein